MPSGIYKRVKPVWNKGKKLGPNPELSKKLKGRLAWNKGLKGWAVGTKAGFQKGHKFYKGGEKGWFSKGNIPETAWQLGDSRISGEKQWNWKGDDVGYSGIHSWVKKNLGKPTKCEYCGKDGLTGRQIGWANKYHTYKRNLNDWLRLCVKCHCKYDKNHFSNSHEQGTST